MPNAIERTSVETYLLQEQESEDRHEFFDGEVFAMSGGSPRRSLTATNFSGETRSALKGSNYQAYNSGLKIKVDETGLYTYPDASIICGPVESDPLDKAGHPATNPTVLVEVLSPTTEQYDRGTKARHYRQIPTLQNLLLISQDRAQIEHYQRQKDGSWKITDFSDLDASIQLQTPSISISIAEIYRDVEFDEPPTAP